MDHANRMMVNTHIIVYFCWFVFI